MSTVLPKPILITNADEAAKLDLAKAVARVMDSAVVVPGTNVKLGLDAVLGLLPGIGDAISSAIGSYIVLIASHLGVPKVVLGRMLLNLGIDAVIGIVPLVGDLLDIGWKANTRNAALLEQALADPKGTARSSRWVMVGLAFALLLIGAAGVALTWFLIEAIRG